MQLNYITLLQQIKQVSIKLNSIVKAKKSIQVKYFLKIMNKLRYYNIISQSRLEYILTYLQTFYPIFIVIPFPKFSPRSL